MVGYAQTKAALSTISAQILLRQSTIFKTAGLHECCYYFIQGREWSVVGNGKYTPILQLLAGGPGSLILHRFPNSFSSTLKFEISKQKDSGNVGPVTE